MMIDGVMQNEVRDPETSERDAGLHNDALENVPVDVMAEFMRQYCLDLVRLEIIEKRICQDDAPRGAESGKSRIRLFALLRQLPAIDPANARTRVFTEQDQPAPQVFVLQGFEFVENGKQYDR